MSLLKTYSLELAVEVVAVSDSLKLMREFVLANQILRSGTSIGANISEAFAAQSLKDFIAKLSIAHKELRETEYWLELFILTKKFEKSELDCVNFKLDLVAKLLVSIIKTSKSRLVLSS